ncbi:phosphatase PAP2 family protein [Ekhidna sp. To15]|uniref:phosphatase PAP2 family protein n=1 Tax=Ekhidna sp. To15 TaxID=3395267 RepID=UPI003F51C7A5
MIDRLRNTRLFFIPYLSLFTLAVVYFLYKSHGEFVLWLNGLHNPVWNFFFKYWTHTGDAIFFTIITVVLIFFKRRFGLILGLSGISVALVSLFFKHILFPEAQRPIIYFRGYEVLDFVDGVTILSQYSFPSGHAMAVFAMASFVALMLQNNNYSSILFIGATLTAISRIYLVQHFLIDILAGSLIGITIGTMYYMAFEKYLNHELIGEVNTPDEDLEKMDLDEDIE